MKAKWRLRRFVYVYLKYSSSSDINYIQQNKNFYQFCHLGLNFALYNIRGYVRSVHNFLTPLTSTIQKNMTSAADNQCSITDRM